MASFLCGGVQGQLLRGPRDVGSLVSPKPEEEVTLGMSQPDSKERRELLDDFRSGAISFCQLQGFSESAGSDEELG